MVTPGSSALSLAKARLAQSSMASRAVSMVLNDLFAIFLLFAVILLSGTQRCVRSGIIPHLPRIKTEESCMYEAASRVIMAGIRGKTNADDTDS